MSSNNPDMVKRSTESPGLSRRGFLGTAAAATALAAAGSLLPPSVQAAMAKPTPPGSLQSIKHVIVLMQENRSFDHYFGSLRGVRGYGDHSVTRLPNGKSMFEQPRATGETVLPFSLRKAAELAGRPGSDIQYLGDLDHSFKGTTTAWNHGWCDKWIPAKSASTMTFYERQDIPLQYELADTFTICDAYHCSVNGSTNPNRNYLWSGTTGNEPGSSRRAVTNAAYGYDHGGYDWTTYPERLEQAGVSWKIYQDWDNFTDNAVEYFQTFKAIGRKMLASVEGTLRTTEEFYDNLAGKSAAEQERLLAQLEQGRAKLTDAERSLFDKAMWRGRPDTLLERLNADITGGTLPQVSWLVPSAADSEHPGASTPVGSANFVYRLLDTVASNPDTWDSTAIFLNFDENDGYFDHVPPPVQPRPASGESPDWTTARPIGLGPRVPMTVVSPWTVGGYVSSEVFDHTSVLRFLERWTGVEEPNISAWRRQVCGDLTGVFNFSSPGTPPVLDHPGPVPAKISRWRPTPPAVQVAPIQESGSRPARPLPYRPKVSAVAAPGKLTLALTNTGSRSTHFAIYGYAGELAEPRHVDVLGNDAVELLPASGAFDVVVTGPNRFQYELKGTTAGAASGVDVTVNGRRGNKAVELEVRNNGGASVTLAVKSLQYAPGAETVKLKAGQSKKIGWETVSGWYDVEVTSPGDPTFRRRLTGRDEDGREGISG
ncbi:phosphocholine-specific phospholipase C [Paenarthrobacter sp. AB444]|uniref:phosphocholine-specific phospholipase C n=1 Tax=Paenarthrobacter sp. AB444 TaxID=3025681 RepID=UPI0023657821|nr:phospholipase C, phosphocholine-specific [Paenarthrobacter sp. AB444]MDD7836133.1 phospholipase C, phosphocholine-specific [Paenarthrobacter sp. AB444]